MQYRFSLFSIFFSRSPRKTLYSSLANNFILLLEFWSFHNGVTKKSILLLFQKASLGFQATSRLKMKRTEWGSLRNRKQLPTEAVSYPNIAEVIANFFTMGQQPGPLHYQGFTTIFRHTTIGRIPPHEWSARRRDLYLTTNNKHERQTSMPPTGFEPTIPATKQPQIHALDARPLGPALRKLCWRKNEHKKFRKFSKTLCSDTLFVCTYR